LKCYAEKRVLILYAGVLAETLNNTGVNELQARVKLEKGGGKTALYKRFVTHLRGKSVFAVNSADTGSLAYLLFGEKP
jgi:hypothetical protein